MYLNVEFCQKQHFVAFVGNLDYVILHKSTEIKTRTGPAAAIGAFLLRNLLSNQLISYLQLCPHLEESLENVQCLPEKPKSVHLFYFY